MKLIHNGSPPLRLIMEIIKLDNDNYLVNMQLEIGQQFQGFVIVDIKKYNQYYKVITCNINYNL